MSKKQEQPVETPELTRYFFPAQGKSVEAESLEDAVNKLADKEEQS